MAVLTSLVPCHFHLVNARWDCRRDLGIDEDCGFVDMFERVSQNAKQRCSTKRNLDDDDEGCRKKEMIREDSE